MTAIPGSSPQPAASQSGRRAPFTQTMRTPFGQMEPAQFYRQRDAFIQSANDQAGRSMANAGTYQGQGRPPASWGRPTQYNPQQMWSQAGQMVQQGWQNPYSQDAGQRIRGLVNPTGGQPAQAMPRPPGNAGQLPGATTGTAVLSFDHLRPAYQPPQGPAPPGGGLDTRGWLEQERRLNARQPQPPGNAGQLPGSTGMPVLKAPRAGQGLGDGLRASPDEDFNFDHLRPAYQPPQGPAPFNRASPMTVAANDYSVNRRSSGFPTIPVPQTQPGLPAARAGDPAAARAAHLAAVNSLQTQQWLAGQTPANRNIYSLMMGMV